MSKTRQTPENTCKSLEEFLASPEKFVFVNLYKQNITDTECAAIAQVLEGNSTIESLWLSHNAIRDEGAKSLAETILNTYNQGNSKFRELHLDNNLIGKEGADALAKMIEPNKTIINFRIDENDITSQGHEKIKEAWGERKILTFRDGLRLGEQTLETADQSVLSTANTIPFTQIESFQAAKETIQAIRENGDYIFNLSSNQYYLRKKDGSTVQYNYDRVFKIVFKPDSPIGQFIRSPYPKTSINLDNFIEDLWPGTVIDDKFWNEVSFRLKLSKGDSFSLRNNMIEDDVAILLTKAVQGHKYLTKVILEDNFIGDEGASALSNLFISNPKFNSLNLKNNNVTDEGAKSIDTALSIRAKTKVSDATHDIDIELSHNPLISSDMCEQIKDHWDNVWKFGGQCLLNQNTAKALHEENMVSEPWYTETRPARINTDFNIVKSAPHLQGDKEFYKPWVNEILNLLSAEYFKIQGHYEKGLLLLGPISSGKTTLAHALTGRGLKISQYIDEFGDNVTDIDSSSKDDNSFNGSFRSAGSINKYNSNDGSVIWDLPGFSCYEYHFQKQAFLREIVNKFYAKMIFEITDRLKFVLVVPEEYILNEKEQYRFEMFLSYLTKTVDLETLKEHTSLVISKTDKGDHKQTIGKLFTQDNPAKNIEITDEIISFIHSLAQSRDALQSFESLSGYEDGDIFKVNETMIDAVKESGSFVKVSPNRVSNEVSTKAKEYSTHLFSTISHHFMQDLEFSVETILEAFAQCTDAKKSILVGDLIRALTSKKVSSLGDAVENLQAALKTVKNMHENVAKQKEIQDSSNELVRDYKFMEFVADICGAELDYTPVENLIGDCQAYIENNI